MSDAPLPTPSSTPPQAPHVHAEPRDKPRRLARWRLVVAIILAVLLVAVGLLWLRSQWLFDSFVVATTPAFSEPVDLAKLAERLNVGEFSPQDRVNVREYVQAVTGKQGLILYRVRCERPDSFVHELRWCEFQSNDKSDSFFLINSVTNSSIGSRPDGSHYFSISAGAGSPYWTNIHTPLFSASAREVLILYWALGASLLFAQALLLWPLVRRCARAGECPRCHYDLRGTPTHTAALDPSTAAEQAIPSPTKTCPECGWTGFV